MTPRQAQKIAMGMQVLNIATFLTTIMSIILVTVELTVASPEIWQEDVPQRTQPKNSKSSMMAYRHFWQANILENKPRIQNRPIAPKKRVVSPKVVAKTPPQFSVVTIVSHSEDTKAYAVLLDKRTREQILVRKYASLPNSKYKVAQITQQKIFLRDKDYVTSLEKEIKPQQKKATKPLAKPKNGLEVIDGEILVVDNLATTIANLQNGDRILSIDDISVQTIEQFFEKINSARFVKISVARHGEIISVYTIK